MGCLRHTVRFVALIIFLAIGSNARPGFRHIDHGLMYGRSTHDIMTSNHQLRSLNDPIWSTGNFPSKRMMPGVTPILRELPMSMVHFESIRPIVPVHKASRFFSQFYANIAFLAANTWARTPRKNYFTVREGNFILTFNAVGDTIPWDLVKELAERLWACSRQGLTDLFDVYYTSPDTKIALQVSLRIIDHCLSSSSDDFCYREGSVESVTGPDMSDQVQRWAGN